MATSASGRQWARRARRTDLPFRVELHTVEAHVRGEIAGDLDLATAPVLLDTVGEAAGDGLHGGGVVVDVSRLEFVDVVGMTALEAAAETVADRGGRLVLRRCCPPLRRLLALVRSPQLDEAIGETPRR